MRPTLLAHNREDEARRAFTLLSQEQGSKSARMKAPEAILLSAGP